MHVERIVFPGTAPSYFDGVWCNVHVVRFELTGVYTSYDVETLGSLLIHFTCVIQKIHQVAMSREDTFRIKSK